MYDVKLALCGLRAVHGLEGVWVVSRVNYLDESGVAISEIVQRERDRKVLANN